MSEIRTIPPRLTRNEWNALVDHGLEKTATYIIRKSGTEFQAINGSTGKIDYRGTDAKSVIQAAINSLGSNYGTVFLKDIDEPPGLTVPDGVIIVSFYAGYPLGKALYLDKLAIATWHETCNGVNNQVLEIQSRRVNSGTKIHVKPNGTPAGEWTTLIAFWNDDNRVMEFTWSNDVFIINSFSDNPTVRPPHDVSFTMQAGEPNAEYMRAYYNAGNPYVVIRHAQLGDNNQDVWIPNNIKSPIWKNSSGNKMTGMYVYTDDVFVIEHYTGQSIKVATNTPTDSKEFFFESDGDFKIATKGKGIILTNADGTITKRVRLNDTGDGLIFEEVS